MAKKVKDYYGKECAVILAQKIHTVYPAFNSDGFIQAVVKGVRDREYSQRLDVYVACFAEYLPYSYTKTLAIFKKILGPTLSTPEGMFSQGWWCAPLGRFVETYAHTHPPEQTLPFIYELTQRYTGEFAIRNLLVTSPQIVLPVLQQWAHDPSVHVRRCASEAIRLRLPWAKKNRIFIEHFETCFSIIDTLKNDPEKFVQKSVANNLNDLSKDDILLYKKILSRWQSPSSITQWIIKHGSRSITKTP